MRQRKFYIVFIIIAAVCIGAIFALTRPSKPTVSDQPQPETQVAAEESTYTDSRVLGSDTDQNNRQNPPENQVTAFRRTPVSTAVASTNTQPTAPVSTPATEPTPPAPPQPAVEDCDENYVPCVPLTDRDLECSEIDFSVTVKGDDRHGFDDDNDGTGCEENIIIQEPEINLIEQPKLGVRDNEDCAVQPENLILLILCLSQ